MSSDAVVLYCVVCLIVGIGVGSGVESRLNEENTEAVAQSNFTVLSQDIVAEYTLGTQDCITKYHDNTSNVTVYLWESGASGEAEMTIIPDWQLVNQTEGV
jgi:hypothetical protein